jgi:opacity protein-like surface antigen
MNERKMLAGGAILAALIGSACAAERVEDPAPEVTFDGLEARDIGTEAEGWSFTALGTVHFYPDPVDPYAWAFTDSQMSTQFNRNSGSDATRGGGSCYVESMGGTTCSADTDCGSNPDGAGRWHYCYAGYCYRRPGGQDLCTMSPSNAPSSVQSKWWYNANFSVGYMLTCMTRTGVPSNACALGTTSNYVRSLNHFSSLYH